MINPRFLTLLLVLLCACSFVEPKGVALSPTKDASIPAPSPAVRVTVVAREGECFLTPFPIPTMPVEIPDKTKLDETTGLHMTGKVQVIDPATYQLKVTGKVEHALSLSLDDLRCMPKITVTSDLTCYGVFNDNGTWSGVPIKYVLEQAGMQESAKEVVLTSSDGFFWNVPLEDALNDLNFLAYEMEGKPLPILHGFPVRAVFPFEPGGQWVKWLVELRVE